MISIDFLPIYSSNGDPIYIYKYNNRKWLNKLIRKKVSQLKLKYIYKTKFIIR